MSKLVEVVGWRSGPAPIVQSGLPERERLVRARAGRPPEIVFRQARLRRQIQTSVTERFSRRVVEQRCPGALRRELSLVEPSERNVLEAQAVEGVHGRQEHASRLPQDDGGGSPSPFSKGSAWPPSIS